MLGSSRVAAQLAASEEGLSSMSEREREREKSIISWAVFGKIMHYPKVSLKQKTILKCLRDKTT
jgi:hypothetical protein